MENSSAADDSRGGKSVYREYRKLRPVARSVRQRLLSVVEQCNLQARKAAGVCTHALCAPPPSQQHLTDGGAATVVASTAADQRRLLNANLLVSFCQGVVRTGRLVGGGDDEYGGGRPSAAVSRAVDRDQPRQSPPPQRRLLGRRRQRWPLLAAGAAPGSRATRLWSAWLQRSMAYRSTMTICTIVHCLCIGVALDAGCDNASLMMPERVCTFATVCAFCLDVAIKWTLGFAKFWRSPWNVLDAALSALALLSLAYPPTAGFRRCGGGGGSLAVRLRCVGALRLLRCVRDLEALRTPPVPPAVAAVAWQRALGLAGLFAALAYAYALVGTTLFEAYTHSTDDSLAYREAFADVGAAMVTLARLASLNWYRLYADASRVVPVYVVAPYVVTWIVAGHYVLGSFAIGLLAAVVRRTREWSAWRRRAAVAELRTAERNACSLKNLNAALAKMARLKQAWSVTAGGNFDAELQLQVQQPAYLTELAGALEARETAAAPARPEAWMAPETDETGGCRRILRSTENNSVSVKIKLTGDPRPGKTADVEQWPTLVVDPAESSIAPYNAESNRIVEEGVAAVAHFESNSSAAAAALFERGPRGERPANAAATAEDRDESAAKSDCQAAGWDAVVNEAMLALSSVDAVTRWTTRDLLNYYAALERLVENASERVLILFNINERLLDMLC